VRIRIRFISTKISW